MPPKGIPVTEMTPDELIELGKELKEEIKERDVEGRFFLPDEWRKLRLQGYTVEQLDRDYDLCHVWR